MMVWTWVDSKSGEGSRQVGEEGGEGSRVPHSGMGLMSWGRTEGGAGLGWEGVVMDRT